MFCAISGTTPTHPVVTPGGVLYERSLIVKAIEVRTSERTNERATATAEEGARTIGGG